MRGNLIDERTMSVISLWGLIGYILLDIALGADVYVRGTLQKQSVLPVTDIFWISAVTNWIFVIGAAASGVNVFRVFGLVGINLSKFWIFIPLLAVTGIFASVLAGVIPFWLRLIATGIFGISIAGSSIWVIQFISNMWERRKLGNLPREE